MSGLLSSPSLVECCFPCPRAQNFLELFEEIWKKLLSFVLVWFRGGRRGVSILSLNTSSSYNKNFLAKKIPWRDLWCNCRQAGEQGEPMPALQLQGAAGAGLVCSQAAVLGSSPCSGLSEGLCPCSRSLVTASASSCLARRGKTQADNGISADRRMPGVPRWQ